MMVRNVAGRPARALVTILGIALAIPMVVLGLFWRDAIDHMIAVQFDLVQRGNATITFLQPVDADAVRQLAREPGVLLAEGERDVPVRLRAGHRSYLTAVQGLSPGSELRRPRDKQLKLIPLPSDGLLLGGELAEQLGVTVGDVVTVEVLEGRQRRSDVEVVGTTDEVLGMTAYMAIAALNRLTGEQDTVSAASLRIEPGADRALGPRLKQLPIVASVTMKSGAISSFVDKIGGLVLVSATILTCFAIIIAVGVVYNSARVGLQERGWELASLRVLGFTRAEVAMMLFGEFLAELILAIPLGLWLSKFAVELIARFHSTQTFRIPAVSQPRTYAAAVLVVAVAAAASAWAVRRRIDRLDLVAVLKTRD